jgi:MFS family permease
MSSAGPIEATGDPRVADSRAPVTDSPGYLRWLLGLLIAVYASSALDRLILSTLGPAIKRELLMTDLQFGLLGGIAFALLYTTMGLPIARLADRHSRVTIISIAVAFWSGMTALCGLAGSFAQLLLFRMGVSLGEAGCSPPCYSLISDHFPRERRASAIAWMGLGVPLGAMIGAFIGGAAAEHLSWRTAFFIAGLPGLLLALLVRLTLKEPARGRFDADAGRKSTEVPKFSAVLRRIVKRPAFLNLTAAASLCIFCNFGINLFLPTFFVRVHHLGMGEVGLYFGLINGVAAAAGVTGLGLVIGRLGRGDARWYGWGPGILLLAGTPFYVWAFVQPSLDLTLALLLVFSPIAYCFLGPAMGATQNMVEPRMRASAAAIFLFVMNIIGGGLGPLFMGWASDHFAAGSFLGDYVKACPAGLPPANATQAAAKACTDASAYGVKWALAACACFLFWAGIHSLLAARTIRRDMAGDAAPDSSIHKEMPA